MDNDKTKPATVEDSEAKKSRLMSAIKRPDPPTLPSFSPKRPAQAEDVSPEPETEAQVSTNARTEQKSPSRTTGKPNFKAMRRSAEERDPVAGKSLADDKMVQKTHYVSARESREFKILTVLNGHSMNEVIRHAILQYIELHRSKLPR